MSKQLEVKRAVVYCRVSTAEQAREGISLEAQEARGRAWAAARAVPVVSVHVDAGVSGTRTDRPALAAALVSLEQGDALVVYSLSRLSRGLRHLIDLADILDARGVALVSLTESLDTTSASGRLFFHMMAALSQFERDLLSERVAAALAQKRARGERLGRPRYENPDAERLARDLGHRGASLRMIAAALLQAGHRPQRASAWSAKVVRDLLRREIGT